MTKIATVRQREKLSPRREPYWHAMGTGEHVGYRRTEAGGHWIARRYDAGTRKRAYQPLDLGGATPGEQFTRAVQAAREWFDHVHRGGQTELQTVAEAWGAYVEDRRKRKGEVAAADAAARYRRHVEGDPIARIRLLKLTAHHVEQWRDRIASRPAEQAKRGPNCRTTTPLPPPRQKSAATLNRDMVSMRAALRLAHRRGYLSNYDAIRQALDPVPGADGKRETYLSKEQRRALLDAMLDDRIRAFVRALCLLPLRPGALAACTVADLDVRGRSLNIRHDKANAGRRIPLSDQACALLREQARGKLPHAPLLSRWDGMAWNKDTWMPPVRAAVEAAGLPPEATLYCIRHSTISDMLSEGMASPMTVALIAGTSMQMLSKTYAHLIERSARDALEGLAL